VRTAQGNEVIAALQKKTPKLAPFILHCHSEPMAVAPAPSPAVALNDIVGDLPTKRLSKEQLVKTHMAHVQKQQVADGAPKQVKQLNPNDAYPPSTKSIRDVEIVRNPDLRKTGTVLTRSRSR
jgi:hypothetical protein